jgi:peptidoglycan/xylan/chitin deacetylase (PgdA/CDA1 family)
MMAVPDRLGLCYHALSDGWPALMSVTPDRFRWQLHWLAERGYGGVTFSELVEGRARGRQVAVTFDDGYLSVLRHGLPVLEELGWPGTIFVPTALLDERRPLVWPGIDHWVGTEHEHELIPLSWGELGDLRARGWEIGSHTRTHPRLTSLTDAQLDEQLAGSRADCEERLGTPCRSVAYPYGDVDPRVVAAAARAGYATGAALPKLGHRPRELEWPRVGVYHPEHERRFRTKVSPTVRVVRRTAVWRLVRALRDRRARGSVAGGHPPAEPPQTRAQG